MKKKKTVGLERVSERFYVSELSSWPATDGDPGYSQIRLRRSDGVCASLEPMGNNSAKYYAPGETSPVFLIGLSTMNVPIGSVYWSSYVDPFAFVARILGLPTDGVSKEMQRLAATESFGAPPRRRAAAILEALGWTRREAREWINAKSKRSFGLFESWVLGRTGIQRSSVVREAIQLSTYKIISGSDLGGLWWRIETWKKPKPATKPAPWSPAAGDPQSLRTLRDWLMGIETQPTKVSGTIKSDLGTLDDLHDSFVYGLSQSSARANAQASAQARAADRAMDNSQATTTPKPAVVGVAFVELRLSEGGHAYIPVRVRGENNIQSIYSNDVLTKDGCVVKTLDGCSYFCAETAKQTMAKVVAELGRYQA